MITRELTPVFQRQFASFRFMEVVSFSNGSIITVTDLSFLSTSVPNNTQIANVLINASSTVTGFDIEGSSVNVNGQFLEDGSEKNRLGYFYNLLISRTGRGKRMD
ncbi:hypothetical protein L3Q82_004064 [Scortum barcoo]|uniref:Uncharacterized protein n=1 Tax=Scortum barcoo TaxID=214431 RepID=A0ACB8X635_9TELE|nr:hypothetical protein L3Q82_004064 [Scortum barcoo]